MPLLFAYGTLRASAKRSPPDLDAAIAAALSRAEHLGRAAAAGRLHWMGAYPAMIGASADDVIGDVYRIDEALWPLLDSYEGGAYVRESILVTLETGAEMTAFAYLARDPAALGARIESGDFLK